MKEPGMGLLARNFWSDKARDQEKYRNLKAKREADRYRRMKRERLKRWLGI